MKAVLIILLILIALFLFTTMPRLSKKKEWKEFTKGTYFAHRGLFDNESDAPENSLKAFKRAIDNNYGVEFDVEITKDKQLVIHHDDTLQRSAGVDLRVCETTYEELKKHKLFKSDETIPLFTEVLDLIDGQIPIIIEIKVDKDYLPLTEMVAKTLENYKGPYVVESFHPLAVRWYKKNKPEIIRGQLCDYYPKAGGVSFPLSYILAGYYSNFLTRPDFLAENFQYSDRLTFQIEKKLYNPCRTCYTVKSKEQLESAKKNFDNYIFDSFNPRD